MCPGNQLTEVSTGNTNFSLNSFIVQDIAIDSLELARYIDYELELGCLPIHHSDAGKNTWPHNLFLDVRAQI